MSVKSPFQLANAAVRVDLLVVNGHACTLALDVFLADLSPVQGHFIKHFVACGVPAYFHGNVKNFHTDVQESHRDVQESHMDVQKKSRQDDLLLLFAPLLDLT